MGVSDDVRLEAPDSQGEKPSRLAPEHLGPEVDTEGAEHGPEQPDRPAADEEVVVAGRIITCKAFTNGPLGALAGGGGYLDGACIRVGQQHRQGSEELGEGRVDVIQTVGAGLPVGETGG